MKFYSWAAGKGHLGQWVFQIFFRTHFFVGQHGIVVSLSMTCDPAVAGSISITAHVVIALGKQFTYIFSVHPSVRSLWIRSLLWTPGAYWLGRCQYYVTG